jgi:glycosyltransferase involved in cell wall biosynthesis
VRIVQLLPELHEGGVERGTVELNREFVLRGHESHVISHGGRLAATIERDGGHHHLFDVVRKNPFTVPLRVARLRSLLTRLRPDVVHARSRVPAWLAWLALRGTGIPFVTTVHGFNSVNAYSRIMTRGDRVICVSGAIRDYIRHHYGVPDEKMVVIPRGVDLEHFDPDRVDQNFMTEFSRSFGLEGRFVVTSVGRITQLKDYETFIRAIARVAEEIPEILALIVGGVREDKAAYFASLKKLVDEMGLTDKIRFTGNQQKVAEIYALSDVVVSSSKKPESFGRSAAEALAMGVPVIASAHGGILDIVREGETGFLFGNGNAEELTQKIIDSRIVKFADLREFVSKNFSLEQMVEKTFGVYCEFSDNVKDGGAG